jgi:Tol biopolymer transport system component
MNKHLTHSLKFFLLLILALSSGCGPVTAIPSPTLTPAPPQTPTATVTPSPTNTPEPIHPDGTLIYSDSHHIYSVDLRTQETKTIFETDKLLGIAIIIKSQIYITTNTKSNENPYLAEIIRLNLDGTNIEQLASNAEKYSSYYLQSISPNEEYLVFYGARTMFILDTNTKSIQSIPEEDSHRLFSMMWSPDSKKIFFLDAVYSSGWGQSRLLKYSVGTNKLETMLPKFPNPNFILDPENPASVAIWSPDKVKVLLNLSNNFSFLSKNVVQPYLYIYNTTNQDLEQIELPGEASTVIWLRDGEKILLGIWDENQPSIFLLDTKSKELKKIKDNEYIYDFSWSPDYQKLVISTQKDKQTYLYLFDKTNSSLELLSDIGYLQNPFNMSWSPNSDMVLYEQTEPSLSEKHYLYLLDINQETTTRLQSEKGVEVKTRITEYWWWYHPTWSYDGTYFAYLTLSSNQTDHQQDFFLNIHSVQSMESIEIQIPSQGWISNIYWLSSK